MTISRAANASGSSDAVTLHTGGPVIRAAACATVDAFGVVQGESLKHVWLSSAGAATTPDPSPGSTTNTGNSTAAVYYEVPAGKVAQIRTMLGTIYDNGAASSWADKLGSQAAPLGANEGIRIRTVDTDETTTLQTLIGSANNNLFLAHIFGHHGCTLDKTNGDTALRLSYALPMPITLTAGQRFEVKPGLAVAYDVGLWSLYLTESDAA